MVKEGVKARALVAISCWFLSIPVTAYSYHCNDGSASSSFWGTHRSFAVDHNEYLPRGTRCRWSMKVKVGILGLPNSGKSTLFNALARRSIAEAANYPFCTIEPNVASIAVPDPFLHRLGRWSHSRVCKSAVLEWIDVAGLVRGAHRGDGLGNRFLGTLRECQVLCHVIRVFDDSNVGHVDGMVDPVSDANVVQLELILADLEHAARRLDKKSCTGVERETLEVVVEGLERGRLAGDLGLSPDALASIKSMGLLTLKPVIYAFNVDEVDFVYRSRACQSIQNIMNSIQYCDPLTDLWTLVSAKVEAEVAALPDDQQSTYLMDLGMEDVHQSHGHQTMLCYHSLPTMVQRRLCLSTVYTGPGVPAERSQTTKAHLLVPNDDGATTTTTTTYDLAGRLHRDIQKGFIRAEVSSAGALLEQPNYQAAKEAGLTHVEGREYVLQPNDVVLIKWN